MHPRLLKVATYNVHEWVGTDGKTDMERTLSILAEIDADLIALQEVSSPSSDEMSAAIFERTGMHTVAGRTLYREDSQYGNVVLSRWPLSKSKLHDLSAPNREPRGAIQGMLEVDGVSICILATHLGLSSRERRQQRQKLLNMISDQNKETLTILTGDFNEWNPRSRTLRILDGVLGRNPHPATFPSKWPLFNLDRIWVSPHFALRRVYPYRSKLSQNASDHLPLVGEIDLSQVLAPSSV